MLKEILDESMCCRKDWCAVKEEKSPYRCAVVSLSDHTLRLILMSLNPQTLNWLWHVLPFAFQKLHSRIMDLSAADLLLEPERSKAFLLSRNIDSPSNVSLMGNMQRGNAFFFFFSLSSHMNCPGRITAPQTPLKQSLQDIKIQA